MVDVNDMSIESLEKHLERMKKERDEKEPKVFAGHPISFKVLSNGDIIISHSLGDKIHLAARDTFENLDSSVELSKKRRGN